MDFVDNPVSFIKRWKSDGGLVVHLTMYGLPLDEVMEQISSTESRVLVVVGSEKVEGFRPEGVLVGLEVYKDLRSSHAFY